MDQKKYRPFGWRDKMGYMFGDFGNDFTFLLSTMLLMKFYTDVMDVSALAVGNIMMVARVVDAFTDVAMGRIADHSRHTAVGKFKPWLMRMCIPVAAASFLMYQSGLSGLSSGLKTAYLAVTYLLWGSFCYTAINIPYGSMASAISADPGDRQSLSTFRTMGGVLAAIVINLTLPAVVYTTDAAGNSVLVGSRVTFVAGVFSLCAILCYIASYRMVTERVQQSEVVEKPQTQPLNQMLKSAFGSRALVSMIAATVLMLVAQLTIQNMTGYVYPNYYGAPEGQFAATVCMALGMITAAFLAKPLSQRMGKAEVSAVSGLLSGGVNIALYFLRPESVWMFVGFQYFSWVGLGVFSMVTWALITDVIDELEIRNGLREDGSVYALYSWARKLGQALSAGVSGWMLERIGYTAQTAFDPAVTAGIFDIAVLVPGVGFVLMALVLWLFYPLKKQTVENNFRILQMRHGR